MLNTNDRQRQQYAAKEYNLKLRLERLLIPSLLVFFREYGKDFQERYANLGLFPDQSIFQEQMKDILQPHYEDVADVFSKRMVSEVGKPDNHDDVLNSIGQRTILHHQNTADKSSRFIMETTQKKTSEAVTKTTEAAIVAGVILTRTEIARRSRAELDRTNANRVEGIAITETQASAEHAKQAEIDLLDFHNAKINGVNISEREKQKMWDAILDGATRPAHAEADGQIVPFDQPYTVGGEKLMHPGDTNLGASLWNILGCRCGSTPIIR
jgi:uncharacterized protein with gpF-like domain